MTSNSKPTWLSEDQRDICSRLST
uniref:Uncharacterized protein n=1 Tax=Anguilla anguilla TaxID=7936 RepID=A0A0E9SMD9_ANGAN